MNIILNNGSGSVNAGTKEQADFNIKRFVYDLGLDDITIVYKGQSKCGRFEFLIGDSKQDHEILMPGIEISKVRYIGENQNIFDFPRLYVDGSSWVWKYALQQCFNEEETD